MGDLPRWKMLVSLWWVTYPNERCWSHCYGWPTQKKLWSHYDGWPTQRKMVVSLWWAIYPNERCWSHYDGWPTQIKDVGLIVMGDLPRKSDGLIVMGDLPKERCKDFFKKMVSLLRVTYPEKMMVSL
jgi:hypothetical protein